MNVNFVINMLIVATVAKIEAFTSYTALELPVAGTDAPGPGSDEDYDPNGDYDSDEGANLEKSPVISSSTQKMDSLKAITSYTATTLLPAPTYPTGPAPDAPDYYYFDEGANLEKSPAISSSTQEMYSLKAITSYTATTLLPAPTYPTGPAPDAPDYYYFDEGANLEKSPVISSSTQEIYSLTHKNDEEQSLSNESQSLQGSDSVATSNDKKSGNGLLIGRATLTTSGGVDESEPTCGECEVWRKKYEELEKSCVKLSLRHDLLKGAGSGVRLNTEELSAGSPVTLPSSTENEIRHLQCRSLDKKKDSAFILHCIEF